MSDNTTVGHALLARLKAAGIEYFLANAGTDFPPIIEAIAQMSGGAGDDDGPTAMVIPHENVAVSMAHGYAMVAMAITAAMVKNAYQVSKNASKCSKTHLKCLEMYTNVHKHV